MSIATLLAVGIGGALGALCRSKATTILKLRFQGAFPLPTLLINIIACTIAGVLLALQLQLDETLYLALTMGFLGGFSTLSTMNYEAVELISQHRYALGAGYLAATYTSTIGVAAIGFACATLLVG